jgi:hypothetical protein
MVNFTRVAAAEAMVRAAFPETVVSPDEFAG